MEDIITNGEVCRIHKTRICMVVHLNNTIYTNSNLT